MARHTVYIRYRVQIANGWYNCYLHAKTDCGWYTVIVNDGNYYTVPPWRIETTYCKR